MGTSPFAAEFSAKGPKDQKGRSLRDFDLCERIFKYPLSYMVMSRSFEELPGEVKEMTITKITEILKNGSKKEKYARLTPNHRAAICGILTQTSSAWKARLEPK